MSLSPAQPELDAPRERFEPRLPAPVVTYALIAANAVMFLLEWYWSGDGTISAATRFQMGGNLGREALLHEPWRLLSHAFLHGSVMHVGMNMYSLFVLGSGLERLLGASRLLTLYAASALAGGLLSSLVHERLLGVGASGAVWGLMAAEIVWMLRLQRRYGKQAVPGGFAQIAQPLLINLMISFLPGIDLFGHLGGGLMGAAMAMLFPLRLPADDRRWQPWAAAAALVMAACVVTALITGRPWTPLEGAL
jgi:rhomboid protease GluP